MQSEIWVTNVSCTQSNQVFWEIRFTTTVIPQKRFWAHHCPIPALHTCKNTIGQGTDNTSPHFTYTCKAFIIVNAVHLQCTCSRIMIPTSLEVDELEKTYLDSARPWPQSNISTKGTANTKPQN